MNKILILGGAKCVWEDVASVRDIVYPKCQWCNSTESIKMLNDGTWVCSFCNWELTIEEIKLIYDMAAVNDIGARIDRPLIFWASLHPRKLKKWEERRRKNGFPAGYVRYSNKTGKPLVDITMDDWGGSSGLFAIQVALALGYTEIIIAGMPMDMEQAHYFNKKKQWKEAMHFRKAWVEHKAELIPFVRSCSGWTKELLGGPE